jgi:formamidopyrimidine-DNA glycosylase
VPELPEVESLARFLDGRCHGHAIDRVQVLAISALKTYDPPIDALEGLEVAGCSRRGKFVCLEAPPLWLVIHLARAGWLRWAEQLNTPPAKPGRGPNALRLRLDDGAGFLATEQGTEKRLAVYVVQDLDAVEGIARLGPDPLDPGFDTPTFAGILAGRAQQIKGVLTDQSLIAGVGNAYSDEALHTAKLSPFKKASSLTADETERLYDAVVTVLRDAVERSAGVATAGLKAEKKSGLQVHGRAGQACPVCGDTIREVSFATKALQYCPTCQTGGKPLADRRLSRLLK